MDKEAIMKTVIIKWSDEDEAYVASSPVADFICGAGETSEEAVSVFRDMVEIHYEEYKKGRNVHYLKPGRPKKNKVSLNLEVKSDSKELIKLAAHEIGISQGDFIDYLVQFWRTRDGNQSGSIYKQIPT